MDLVSHDVIRSQRNRPGRGSFDNKVLPRTLSTFSAFLDRTVLLSGAVAALIVAWTVVIFSVDEVRFAILAPKTQSGVEAASGLARLFGALVLFLFPADRGGQRLRWVSAGFVILGLGGLAFGYLPTMLGVSLDLNTSIFASLLVRTTAGALLARGLVPSAPPRLTRRVVLVIIALFATATVALFYGSHLLPPLVGITDIESAAVRGDTPLQGLTAWHWAISALPLALAVTAVAGTVRHFRGTMLGAWLAVAMMLLAGSQLHNLFWPSIYSPLLTTADLLRFAFAVVVVVGGILELRRIAAERAVLLEVEQEHTRRLGELAAMKADFTAMVAHELHNPLTAIRGLTSMLATGELGHEGQVATLAAIRSEVAALTALVSDVRAAATVERDGFAMKLRSVPLNVLLADAATFAKTLPGNHAVTSKIEADCTVQADPERIGQVLRNLLSNAGKYSPPSTPIEIRATHRADRVRIEVADQGYGIHPDDLARIFEKFGRGRDQFDRRIAGVGLGLYLSRRIVQEHGSDITVHSARGVGSVFGFELEVAE